MPVTWRTVTAPNNSSANRLSSEGLQTLLGGLSGLSDRLQEPTKEKKAAQKLAFENALKVQAQDLNQQRVDLQGKRINQQGEQFTARQEAELAAAVLSNEQANTRAANIHSNALFRDNINHERNVERDKVKNERAVALEKARTTAKGIADAAKASKEKAWTGDIASDVAISDFKATAGSNMDKEEVPRFNAIMRTMQSMGLPRDYALSLMPQIFENGLINDKDDGIDEAKTETERRNFVLGLVGNNEDPGGEKFVTTKTAAQIDATNRLEKLRRQKAKAVEDAMRLAGENFHNNN